MIDTYRHKGLRKKLVQEIISKGIKDQKVIDAIGKIPRHLFMDSTFDKMAYQDKPFPIGSGQTISQPYTVAFQTELLQLKKGDKVLEVGTGSGYQAAVLLEMGAKVYSIERHHSLYLKSLKLLHDLGFEVNSYYGDGYKGKPALSPFDKIIITAGAPEIPENLIKQLKIGGIMVVPIGSNVQKMKRIIKISENNFDVEDFGDFVFVPMLKGKINS
ncbi:MAG: protein-L-isoaspartate(D-aspartate) O-methyltransferase [Chlorobi bacterium]|nr:protein-L-isoaspartate(D-aspartate) O-methyltransferase [Chlorobiota bacterium]